MRACGVVLRIAGAPRAPAGAGALAPPGAPGASYPPPPPPGAAGAAGGAAAGA